MPIVPERDGIRENPQYLDVYILNYRFKWSKTHIVTEYNAMWPHTEVVTHKAPPSFRLTPRGESALRQPHAHGTGTINGKQAAPRQQSRLLEHGQGLAHRSRSKGTLHQKSSIGQEQSTATVTWRPDPC